MLPDIQAVDVSQLTIPTRQDAASPQLAHPFAAPAASQRMPVRSARAKKHLCAFVPLARCAREPVVSAAAVKLNALAVKIALAHKRLRASMSALSSHHRPAERSLRVAVHAKPVHEAERKVRHRPKMSLVRRLKEKRRRLARVLLASQPAQAAEPQRRKRANMSAVRRNAVPLDRLALVRRNAVSVEVSLGNGGGRIDTAVQRKLQQTAEMILVRFTRHLRNRIAGIRVRRLIDDFHIPPLN